MRTACFGLLPIIAAAFSASPSNLARVSTSKSKFNAIKEGTFGMGCFWEPAEELLKVDGVVSTVAGYTGNPTANKAPTYDSVCFSRDWVEGVRVKYDDEKITYEQLLEAFFESQKPKLGSRQYSSIIFPHDDEQQEIAAKFIQNEGKTQRSDGWMPEWTAIEPLTKFYQAEGYHQNYWQKQRPRFVVILGLLAVATGVLDPIVPLAFQKTLENAANAAVLVIGLYVALERVLDAKVVEI